MKADGVFRFDKVEIKLRFSLEILCACDFGRIGIGRARCFQVTYQFDIAAAKRAIDLRRAGDDGGVRIGHETFMSL